MRIRAMVEAVQEGGGERAPALSEECVEAVNEALNWLLSNQNEDGSWGGRNKVGITALCTYALVAGEGDEHPAVKKAVGFIMGQQKDGAYIDLSAKESPYEQALATLAVSVCSRRWDNEGYRESMERGADVILRGQRGDGSWAYGYSDRGQRDTSISVWQTEALWSALAAGATNAAICDAIIQSSVDVVSVQAEDTGRFGYVEKGLGAESMTGAGLLVLYLAGASDTPEYRLGADILLSGGASTRWPLCGAFHLAQAACLLSPDSWEKTVAGILQQVIEMQADDGSWEGPRAEQKYGRAYATAMCALILQTPAIRPVIMEKSSAAQ
ncbi:MAG: hypothetical protein KJ626_07530 [Verrucomicrobia bacterium]|nr:hypothetical protein [Verrucomicrobiota bacterium]